MENVTVGIGPCRCPQTPHEQDEVYFRPRIGFDGGIAIHGAIQASLDEAPEVRAVRLSHAFITHGAVGWNLVDEQGAAVPFDVSLLFAEAELRGFADAGYPLAAGAENLYAEEVLRPLVAGMSKPSPDGRTASSTSASRRSGQRRRVPSGPSSK